MPGEGRLHGVWREYMWIDWEHCNEVDSSQAIQLRDFLGDIHESPGEFVSHKDRKEHKK
jgi:hypothetical protein